MATLENGNGMNEMTFHAPSVTLNSPLLYLDLIDNYTRIDQFNWEKIAISLLVFVAEIMESILQ